ncbi:MAG TPA: hypothetical protein VFV38_06220, partial [Ktedonobacteraceae bacterium]|nr:hypothetical protein [Ktedonobacteraceae bacterium]
MPDFRTLEFPDAIDEPQEVSPVLGDYLKHIANKKLRLYKQYLHTEGEKQGQSLYSHVMDLVTFVDRLFRAIGLNDIAMRCVLLALTVHDINKIPIYGQDTHGRKLKYADAATEDNIRKELKRLNADAFFPEWEQYLLDIVYLAHAHQAASTATTRLFNQAYIDRTQLKSELIGPLKFLMQATDASDNSHSGNYLDPNEVHLRDKVLIHINGVMS